MVDWGLPLPQHIAPIIFSKLPIFKLSVIRLVSKSWNYLVLDYASSSNFHTHDFLISTCFPTPITFRHILRKFLRTKIHCLQIHSLTCSIDFDTQVTIINHCNGLLFIHYGDFYEGILNPMTKKFFKVPPAFDDDVIHFYGFGFIPKTKTYKLFRIVTPVQTSTLEVYRFGNDNIYNQWCPVCEPFEINILDHGVYLNGVVYWIGSERDDAYCIYALDVETENFESVAVLEDCCYSEKAILRRLNDTLYAIIFIHTPCPHIQMWRMQENCSWIRVFDVLDIPDDASIHLVKVSSDGEILFVLNNDLFCLDKSGKKIKVRALFGNETEIVGACPMESLHFGFLPNILTGHN